MRKGLKNKKIVSAVLVGISAMMALSTPMTAYANDNENPAPEGGNTEAQAPTAEVTESHMADSVQEVAETASSSVDSAETAVDAVAEQIIEEVAVTPPTPETPAAPETPVAPEAQAAPVDSVVDSAEKDLVDAANVAKDDTSYDDAEKAIENADKKLADAEAQDVIAQNEATNVKNELTEAADSVKAAEFIADLAAGTAEDAQKKADELVQKIENAENADALSGYETELAQLITDSNADLATKRQVYDKLKSSYADALEALEAAQANLDKAEDNLDAALDGTDEAKGAIQYAQEAQVELEAAQANVKKLSDALDAVQEAVQDRSDNANAIKASMDTIGPNTNPNWDTQRDVMKNAVIGYVMPELNGVKLTNEIDITAGEKLVNPGDYYWQRVPGFDHQDYNYCILAYKDEAGNDVQKYYNFDRMNKKIGASRYDETGTSYGLFMFEKSAEEVGASEFLNKQFGKKNDTQLREMEKNGDLDVFAYEKDGKTEYLTRAQHTAGIADGTIKEKDGTMMIEGLPIHQVIQNKNNLYHDANVFMVASTADANKYLYTDNTRSTIIKNALKNSQADDAAIAKKIDKIFEDNAAFNAFYSDTNMAAIAADKDAYDNNYDISLAKAEQAVNTAKQETKNLETAINTLKDGRTSRKTTSVAKILGDSQLVADLGLQNMSIAQAIAHLNQKLQDAENKVDAAEAVMKQIKDAADNANRPTFVTPTVVTPDAPSTPSAPAQTETPADAAPAVAVATTAPVAAAIPAAAEAVTPAPAAVAPAAQATPAAQAQVNAPAADAGVTNIADEATPTADAPAGNIEGSIQKRNISGDIVNIADESVALADKAPEGQLKADADYSTLNSVDDMTKKPNLWWLLIILILGEAGREMYKKHQEKMKEKEENIQ